MIDITQAFSTSSEPLAAFYERPGIGYYIPLYQREYSWDEENIDQLMEDICRGVVGLTEGDRNEDIRFLGTVILVKETNPTVNIQPQDSRALPSMINHVIDGQQRISTIALLACLLYQRLATRRAAIPGDPERDDLREAVDNYLLTLKEVFAVDLRRGTPMRKPIIIRGSIDSWTFAGADSDHYKSGVAAFLAAVIRAADQQAAYPPIPRRTLVGRNLQAMNRWLDRVTEAHTSDQDYFPPAWDILANMRGEDLWSYERPDLRAIVEQRGALLTPLETQVCALVQLFAFCHYLLQRCCFTVIQPVSETWAFDMFQSLNATGTPLTALETFKPLVVNAVASAGGTYQGSPTARYFAQVDQLTEGTRTAAAKDKLTRDYLTTFALAQDGTRLSSQFSIQRGWLTKVYNARSTPAAREDFVRRMGDLATYWQIARDFDPQQQNALVGTEGVSDPERQQAALAVLYLQEAGHKMATAVLSRFYALVLRREVGAADTFVRACRAVAAFFTLWRSALPNAGLDEVYRKLLRERMSWERAGTALTVQDLATALGEVLTDRGIGTKDEWIAKATQYLRYDNARTICRFALFVAAHDTIPDPSEPGLMKLGVPGTAPFLEPAKWKLKDFGAIEHVAPQTRPANSDWDDALYDNDYFHTIGNLTLLPAEINSAAGNRRWLAKWIHYRYLAETDPGNVAALAQEAANYGVELAGETIRLLQSTTYKQHIVPIVALGPAGPWDKGLVERRTARICDILWERLRPWLELA